MLSKHGSANHSSDSKVHRARPAQRSTEAASDVLSPADALVRFLACLVVSFFLPHAKPVCQRPVARTAFLVISCSLHFRVGAYSDTALTV